MELSEEQMKQVEYLAGLFYTPKQIAVMVAVVVKEFVTLVQCEDSPIYKAYWKGRYEADLQFRIAVKRLSDLGSSPAQTMVEKMIEESKMQMIDR